MSNTKLTIREFISVYYYFYLPQRDVFRAVWVFNCNKYKMKSYIIIAALAYDNFVLCYYYNSLVLFHISCFLLFFSTRCVACDFVIFTRETFLAAHAKLLFILYTHIQSYTLYSVHCLYFIFIEINKRCLISRPTAAAAASLSVRWAGSAGAQKRGERCQQRNCFWAKNISGPNGGMGGNAKLRMHSCVKMILKLVLNCVRRRRQSKGV